MSAGKSSAHDTEAKVRKFPARRIRAIPSLIRMLLPTRTATRDCCLRIVLSRTRRNCFDFVGFFFNRLIFLSRRSLLCSQGVSLADCEGVEFAKLVFLRSPDIALADLE